MSRAELASRVARLQADTATPIVDTSEYVTKLEKQGLSRQQAESIIDTLEEVIEESVHNMQGNLVTRAEQDKVRVRDAVHRLPPLTRRASPARSTTSPRKCVSARARAARWGGDQDRKSVV